MAASLSTRQFFHDKTTRQFIADISDLGPNPFCQIYPDSCDEGFSLVSQATGKVTDWAVYETASSSGIDGELISWRLKPTLMSLRKNPGLDGYTILLYND